MSAPNDGGPAFPSVLEWRETHVGGEVSTGCADNAYDGMSLRDYFAAKALAGILANAESIRQFSRDAAESRRKFGDLICESAYRLADGMLAARKGGG